MRNLLSPFNFKTQFYCLVLILWSFTSYSQPIIQWQKSLGGTGYEEMNSIRQTFDGGYITAGINGSTNGDFSNNTTAATGQVIKFDALGSIQWQKYFPLISTPDILQTPDSGYLFSGGTQVIKTDSAGIIQWQISLTVTNLRAISANAAGDYFVAGMASGIAGNSSDFYIARLSSSGTILWQKTFGGTSYDGATSICSASDGGCIAVGLTNSANGDVTGFHGGSANTAFTGDCWAVKLDSLGNLQWQRALGGSMDDIAYYSGVKQTADHGYVICCSTKSYDGDVTGFKGGLGDCWLVKLDSAGTLTWQKCLGGTGGESGRGVIITGDGGYLVTGLTGSNNNGDVAGFHGNTDAWIIKLDANGNLIYQKCLGGNGVERGFAIIETTDGGCAISGNCNKANGDVTANQGGYDCWVVKLAPVSENTISGQVYEDLNGNCVKDSNEVGLPGKTIVASPGNYFASTDANGNYTLFVDTGSYVVSLATSTYYNQACPPSGGTYNVTLTALSPASFGNNFADTLTSHCADLSVSVGTTSLRRCFKNNYVITYSNIGAVNAINCTVTVTLDPALIPLSSSIPWALVGGQYVFTIDTIKHGQGGSIVITDSLSCSANFGAVKCVTASISTNTTECTLTNNSASDCHAVIGSFDPNGMEVAAQNVNSGYVLQDTILASDSLSYLVKFQNTGSDTAQNVVVRDTLSNYLNPATVIPGAASFPFTFRIYGQGICEWTFSNINLPDSSTDEPGSHGFLKFSVQQTTGNTIGTSILNSASIWFDFNQYIYTNSTINTITSPTGIQENSFNKSGILIFPNPFSTTSTLISTNELKNASIHFYDVVGREVKRITGVSSQKTVIERGGLPAGIYFYTIEQEQQFVSSGKVVIE